MKSKKGALGQVVTVAGRRGIRKNPASNLVNKFERQAGGKFAIAEKLEAAEGLFPAERELLAAIADPENKDTALAYLIAESKVDPARLVRKYAEGAISLGRAEALAEAAASLGPIARQLIKQASFRRVSCITCLGLGKVPNQIGAKKATAVHVVCPTCKGEGEKDELDAHYKFAVTKIMDMATLGPEKPINVQTNVAVQTNMSGGFMERLSKLTDGTGAIIIDADVQPEDS